MHKKNKYKDIKNPIKTKNSVDYPDISEIKECNNSYKKLFDVYAGKHSELTEIMQFSYQAIVLSDEYPNISKTLKEVMEYDTCHFNVLGEVIDRLGTVPKMKNSQGFNWSSTYVDYTHDPCEMMESNIKLSEKIIDCYHKTKESIDCDELEELLECIIHEEINHIKIFEKILKSLKEEESKGKYKEYEKKHKRKKEDSDQDIYIITEDVVDEMREKMAEEYKDMELTGQVTVQDIVVKK